MSPDDPSRDSLSESEPGPRDPRNGDQSKSGEFWSGEGDPYAAGQSDESSFNQLSTETDPGIIREFVDFLRYNKKWWMTPIIVVTLILIGLAILIPSPVAPFIYTLF